MKPNLNRFAAALLFACAAITCSLTMWATTPGHDAAADTGKTPATGAPFNSHRRQSAGWQYQPMCWRPQGLPNWILRF